MTLNREGSLKKWISIEYRKLNQNLVAHPLTLTELLKMDRPTALTKNDEEYLFDIDALKRLSGSLPDDVSKRLKLPMFFFKDARINDSCYIIDEVAVDALKRTNDINERYRFREKKLWISLPLAFDIQKKYLTLIQFVYR